jgi:hypothetical protein
MTLGTLHCASPAAAIFAMKRKFFKKKEDFSETSLCRLVFFTDPNDTWNLVNQA